MRRQKRTKRSAKAARPPNGQLNQSARAQSKYAREVKPTPSTVRHTKRIALRYCLRGHPDIHGDKNCRVCGAPIVDRCLACGANMYIDLSQEVFSQYDLDKRREIFIKERPLYCTSCKARFPWTRRVKAAQLWQQVFGLVENVRKWLTTVQG